MLSSHWKRIALLFCSVSFPVTKVVDAGNWTDCENVTWQKKNNLIVDNDITQKEIMALFLLLDWRQEVYLGL